MNNRMIYSLGVAILAMVIAGILFLRASFAYSALTKENTASREQVVRASDRSNDWFLVLIGAVAVTNIFLARWVILRRNRPERSGKFSPGLRP